MSRQTVRPATLSVPPYLWLIAPHCQQSTLIARQVLRDLRRGYYPPAWYAVIHDARDNYMGINCDMPQPVAGAYYARQATRRAYDAVRHDVPREIRAAARLCHDYTECLHYLWLDLSEGTLHTAWWRDVADTYRTHTGRAYRHWRPL